MELSGIIVRRTQPTSGARPANFNVREMLDRAGTVVKPDIGSVPKFSILTFALVWPNVPISTRSETTYDTPASSVARATRPIPRM